MRIVLQRVKWAEVKVDGLSIGKIDAGLMLLLGIEPNDTKEDMEWLSRKVLAMRLFDDENGVMNLSVKDIDGEILVVSQFTLYASTKKGNRPSYIKAAVPAIAEPLYEEFKSVISSMFEKPIASGSFGAYMKCELLNDGPITIILDSKQRE